LSRQEFQTVIQKHGSRVFVPIPFNPNDAWGTKQRHYVSGTINDIKFRGSLGSDGNAYFLPLGAAWRRDSVLDVGDAVTVALMPEGPQLEALARDIATALAQEPTAEAFFNSLATFYRKGSVNWIEGAKRPETRTTRLHEMIALLKAGKKQK
jgi:hypothetical protein